jgi:peptide/nickel transport system substrate-binding protein
MRKRVFTLMAVLLSLFLIISGCSKGTAGQNGETSGKDTGKPVDGGTLKMAFGAKEFNDTLIPGLANDSFNANIVRMLFDGLANTNAKQELVPRLAKKWELSPDKMSLTVTLNEKAKWSDGEPVTSDDVLFSLNTFVSPDFLKIGGDGSSLSTLKGYKEISEGKETSFEKTNGFVKISEKQFKLNLNEKDAVVIPTIMATSILPYHVLKDQPISGWQNLPYVQAPNVVSGPYKVKNVQKPTTVILEANKNYYFSKPHIDEIDIQGVNVDVAPGLFANGQLDYMMKGFNVGDVQNLKKIQNVDVLARPGDIFEYIGMKLYKPQFKDLKVRQALLYALPRKLMLDSIYKGNGVLMTSPLPAILGTSASEKDGLNPYDYNVAKANQLLDEAGWKKGSDGNRIDPNTNKPADLKLTYTQSAKTGQAIADSIKKYFGNVGIQVELNPQDNTTKNAKLQKDDPSIDMWIGAWGGMGDDPRGMWSSNDALNWERWKDSENEKLINDTFASDSAFDPDKRKQSLIKWQLYANEQLPLLFLWTYDDVAVKSKRLHIPQDDLIDLGSVYNPQDWWLSK